jgi:Transcriptional Coactivator p15 (PC4)
VSLPPPLPVSNFTRHKAGTYNASWQLSAKRRVTVQEYKGVTLVAFREYYQKDGKDLPGKQGISLNVEQFKALMQTMPEIVKVLAEKGILTPDDTGEEQPDEGNLDTPGERAEEKTGEDLMVRAE